MHFKFERTLSFNALHRITILILLDMKLNHLIDSELSLAQLELTLASPKYIFGLK